MKEPKLFELPNEVDQKNLKPLTPSPTPKVIPLPQKKPKKKKINWKRNEKITTQQLESTIIKEHRKKIDALSKEEAHKLLDQIKIGTLDEHISLQKWIQNLNEEQIQKEVQAFLSRHEINDKLLLTKGFSIFQNYGKVNFIQIRKEIIAMRPNGINTYCYLCDKCHYEVPPNCPKKGKRK